MLTTKCCPVKTSHVDSLRRELRSISFTLICRAKSDTLFAAAGLAIQPYSACVVCQKISSMCDGSLRRF